MKLLKILTENDIMQISYSINKIKTIKRITGLKEDYNVGDTAVKIDNVVQYGFYKTVWNGKTFYYIVLSVLDKDIGHAISLW